MPDGTEKWTGAPFACLELHSERSDTQPKGEAKGTKRKRMILYPLTFCYLSLLVGSISRYSRHVISPLATTDWFRFRHGGAFSERSSAISCV